MIIQFSIKEYLMKKLTKIKKNLEGEYTHSDIKLFQMRLDEIYDDIITHRGEEDLTEVLKTHDELQSILNYIS